MIPSANSSANSDDHFYELYIAFERGGGYFVYYRTPLDLLPDEVPEHAARDGDLIDVHLHHVEYVLEVTPEEYFEHMWE